MSVNVMSLVYKAHFHDITFTHKGKKKATGEEYEKVIKVSNFNLKSVCLALADHSNDEGEGAYPAVETIASKTEISDVTVIACLKAMKQEGILTYTGRSKWDTCNYTVNKEKLIEMAGWERQKRLSPKSKAALVPEVKPLYIEGKAALPEPSLHPKPSIGTDVPLVEKLPIDWQIAAKVEHVVIPNQDEAKRIDFANLVAMGTSNPSVAREIALVFQNERNITLPTDEKKVKGQRKAITEMLGYGVTPNHVMQAIRKLLTNRMTFTDLFGVAKTAIDFATQPQNYAGSGSHAL
jgi:hypothetical protein